VNGSVPCPELVGVDDETNSADEGPCVALPAAGGVTTLAPLTVPGDVPGAGGTTTGLAAGGFWAEAGDTLFVVFDGGELL
jgi:hypothetical protein